MNNFKKIVVARHEEEGQCFARDGEWLIAASPKVKSKVKLRRTDHFFVGIETGLPSLYGWVEAAPEGLTFEDVVEKVMASTARPQIGETREEIETQVRLTLESVGKPFFTIGSAVVSDFRKKNFMNHTPVQAVHKVIFGRVENF